MKKTKRYRYLGKNGIITTSVQLEGIEPIPMYCLTADEGKVLFNGERYAKQIQIFIEDLSSWAEVSEEVWLKSINENK